MKDLLFVPRCLAPRYPAAKQRVLNPECNYSEKKWPASMRRVFLFVCSVILISFLPVTGCEQFTAGGVDNNDGADTSEVGTPPLTGSVTIDGNAEIGEKLTANTKKLDGTGKITYRWTKSDSSTTISKTATYAIKQADNNSQIKVTVTREGYTGTKFATKTIGNPPFEVGDEGPAGGTIIYDNTDHSEGIDWDYMEVAPEDLEAFEWASEGETTTLILGTFSEGIGSGKENTRLILSGDPDAPAALAASEYEHNGFSDWFLPSIGELDLIYANTEIINGGFDGNFYWSSNQNGGAFAYYQDFTDGTPNYGGSKDDAYHVRPVRAFLNTPAPTPTPEPTPSPTTTDSPTPEPSPSPTSTSTPSPTPAPITYTVAADGNATATSTKIDFTFSAAVSGLTANDITIGGSTGAATKGALTGSGTSYSLAITTTAAGAATVSINFSGIESGTKNINLYRYVTYATAANGSATSTSTRIDFNFSESVSGLTAADITIGGSPGAVTKGAISGSGIYWILDITVGTAGAATVSINKTGIESTVKNITLYKPDVITYTATADGSAATTTTKIDFAFSAVVTGLTANDITIGGSTGAATKGALTGSGTSWSLAVTVATAGVVTATVNSSGIDSGAKTVTLYKYTPVTYNATADGNTTTSTTKIDFTFSAVVSGLTANDITIGGSPGAATRGSLTGGGTSYSLAITTTAAGAVTVSINKSGIENGTKTVSLYKYTPITYTVAVDGSATATTTKIDFTFSAAVSGLMADHITIGGSAGAATKGALTGNGTSYSLAITTTAAGAATVSINSSGIESGTKNINLYKYVTYTTAADGGTTSTSTRIDFNFNEPVSGLTAADITIGGSPGAATKGDLSGSGIYWRLDITVGTRGDATVSINKTGIQNTAKPITLYKQITYNAVADGSATASSTKINFTFSESVTGLTANDITIGGSPGAATRGSLTGSGTSYSMAITTTAAGAATVSINKSGIENTAKSINLYKPVTYNATANGSATAATTKIDFTFSAVVTGLTANDITIGGSIGAATRGSLTGSGTSYSLAITTTAAGEVTVSINKSGIENTAKSITLYKPVTYNATPDGSETATSTKIDFTFSSAVTGTGLTANDITINGTGAATKGALTGSGTSYSLAITTTAAGSATVSINRSGIENTAKSITLYKPVTYTATANGSATARTTKIDFTFSAAVSGLEPKMITIDGTGAATRGNLTNTDSTHWSLAVTPTAVGAATVSIDQSGILSGTKSITLYDPLIAAIKFKSPDLSVKLGITTSGTTSIQHVTATFNAIHDYLAMGPEVEGRTSGSSGMPPGLPTKIGGIELGDYIDLVSLAVNSHYTIDLVNFGSNPQVSSDSKLLRLIVVGINSFNQDLGTGYNGNGNGTTAHLVFQFQNSPAKGSMTAGTASQPDYTESGMREYLTVNGNQQFLNALVNAGVPQARMWAPRRLIGNKTGSVDELIDLVWLPTELEMFGIKTYSPISETSANQARLAYYLGNNTRIKLASNGAAINYWAASTLIPQGKDGFIAVAGDGTSSSGNADDIRLGIAPAFCIR
ncbi:hypothetical protein FACS1894190_12640 [Spirochaetia bacterium]|nr:hypothetical protein FACS1894190_12640 [Spirochaetia bacterium]